MPISALQVAGINPSESRSCDYISPPCIYAFRTTLYLYSYMASSIHMMMMMMMIVFPSDVYTRFTFVAICSYNIINKTDINNRVLYFMFKVCDDNH